jgi:predicted transcriptional regulator
MVVADLQTLLSCEVFAGGQHLDRQIMYGCASDLMSDVLAFSMRGALLLTGLINVQTIQTADIAELNAIILVRGKKPDDSVQALAQEKGMPLLGTPYSMYEACGILYRAGIPSTMKCQARTISSSGG